MAEKITFTGSQGDSLSARLDSPENPKAYALFAHCFTCNKDLNAINRISRTLNEQGIALLRFDFTGLGASDGDFANTNFSSNVQDLLAAVSFMEANYEAPKLLIGHSFGGAAVLAAARHIAGLKAVATIAAPADTHHVQKQFACDIETIQADGIAEVELVGRPFTIKRQFLEDIESQTMRENIEQLGCALMVMHSPTDDTVSIDNARQIYDAAMHPKSFITLDDADHLLMKNAKDATYIARLLAAWVERYL